MCQPESAQPLDSSVLTLDLVVGAFAALPGPIWASENVLKCELQRVAWELRDPVVGHCVSWDKTYIEVEIGGPDGPVIFGFLDVDDASRGGLFSCRRPNGSTSPVGLSMATLRSRAGAEASVVDYAARNLASVCPAPDERGRPPSR